MEHVRADGGRRVLVAQAVADGLVQRLSDSGFEVTTCPPADTATVADRVHPHLILMDVPAADGWEQVRRVRERAGRVWLLALIGWEAMASAPPADGCDGHLVRPVSADEIACLLDAEASEVAPCGCS